MPLFFLIFLSTYFALVGYIYVHLYRAFLTSRRAKVWGSFFFWLWALSYIIGEFLERGGAAGLLSDILINAGAWWIGAFVYLFLGCVLYDLWLCISYLAKISPSLRTRIAHFTARSVLVITIIFLLGGWINTRSIWVRELTLDYASSEGSARTMRVVMASDIHLGAINRTTHLARIVDTINSLNPDIVLLPGDILDGDVAPVIRHDSGEAFRDLRSRLGTYGVTGNHEYIGGVDLARAYLIEHGIHLLDETTTVIEGITLVGRKDLSSERYGDGRKSLEEILRDAAELTDVRILLDHQPYDLHQARDNDIDLQVSGHTHYGQLWPVNFIIRKIYEVARGHEKIGNTDYIVSSGVGTWGPPIRTNSRPEIWLIELRY